MKSFLYILAGIILLFMSQGTSQDLPPVAVNDSIIVYTNGLMADTIHEYPVTLNDFDPQGKAFKIREVRRLGYEEEEVEFNDSIIIIHNNGTTDLMEKIFYYRIQQIEDPSLVSNWARLYTNPAGGPDWPIAYADTIFITRWYSADLNLLENDIHPLGDTSRLDGSFYGGDVLTDSIVRMFGNPGIHASSYDRFYFLTDTNHWWERSDVGLIHVQLSNNRFYDSLHLNNINARFYCFGHHFWDLDFISYFTVPNGSNIPSIFNQSFWIGAYDEGGQLHVAAERYRANGSDFYHGPVSDVYDSLYDIRWYHIWNLKREDIDHHKLNWMEPGYEAVEDIMTWPGNGDIENGQAALIAPFEDLNNNGIYEPLLGDVPRIKGDQSLYFVFNDTRGVHNESGGIPLGIEVRGMAYAYDAPEDSALWNTIFLHYDIINRSDTSYKDVYLGTFTDTQLGYGWDDYIQSDVTNGMYFTYNGTEYDPEYGDHPPAQGIMLLAGPYLDPDGVDNPRYDMLGNQVLNESINGMNFGDGVFDNERMGMRTFHYFNGGGWAGGDDPTSPEAFYRYLTGHWNDGSPMFYGGFGHPLFDAVGPECRYGYPGDSDPHNWGTYGLWPHPPYDPVNYFWTEEEAGHFPNDRRGLGTMGPFTLEPGQSQPLDLAFPWARDYDGTAWESALLLKERAAYIRDLFENDSSFASGTNPPLSIENLLLVSPNPAGDYCIVEFDELIPSARYAVFNIHGHTVLKGQLNNNKTLNLDTSQLGSGLYFLFIEIDKKTRVLKFVRK